MSLPPGVIALAQALKDALECSGLTGQIMLNFSDDTLQSVETRTFQRVAKAKSVDKPVPMRA